MIEQLKRCILAESVYNVLFPVRAMYPYEIVNELRAHWLPGWAPVEQVVTPESVAGSLEFLRENKLVDIDYDFGDPKYWICSKQVKIVTNYEQATLTLSKPVVP